MTDNKKRYSIVFCLIVYFITLLVCVSMFLPRNVGCIYGINGNAEKTYGADSISSMINCDISSDGTYIILEPDPHFIINCEDDIVAESLKITIISITEQDVPFQIFYALDNQDFSEENSFLGTILKGKQSAVIDLPKGNYTRYRIDIDQINVKFQNVEIYDEQPVLVPYQPTYSFFDYLITVTLPIILGLVAYLLNKKFGFIERFCKNISENKFKIITICVFCVVAVLLSVLIELIIGIITKDGSFSVYRWIFIAGITELIVAFVFGYKYLKEKPENLFLPIALILGAVMLFGSPIKHICWDLDSHYPWAVQASYPGTTYVTSAYNCVDYVLSQSAWSGDTDTESYEQDIEYLNNSEKIFVSEKKSSVSVAHLPSGIFIAVSRFFGANFAVKYNMGRFANLILYSIICFFAVKRIKSGKMILSVICLLPTNLYLATNYSYDWWVTSFTVLGTSYFVSELQEPDKSITIKDTVIMSLGFAIGALPKLVYIVMMGMMFFMRKNQWTNKDKKRYYSILILVFAIVFLMSAMTYISKMGGSGDSRGGATNPTEQLNGILSAPFDYAKLLSKFLLGYLSIGQMKNYISFFAYLGMGSMYIIPITLVAFTALTDTSEKVSFKIPLYMKVLSVVLLVGMSALIATALYINFTPVGATAIQGCQPRYIVPMLAPMLLLIMGQRVNLVENKSVYNGCVLALMSFTVLFETYSMIIIKML